MSVSREPFGSVSGKPVEQFTLISKAGVTVKIITYGGRISQILAPDRYGKAANINCGFDSLPSYLQDKAYLGTLVGPVANRIANAKFSLGGKTHTLPANDGQHTLHGGLNGFDKAVWSAETGNNSVTLTHKSPDGQDGFPGNLSATVVYTLDGNRLVIDYTANTDKPTPVNLTNHAYFNLAGPGSGDVLGHEMMIASGAFTPVDETLIPTGQLAPVQETPMDFRTPVAIGSRIAQLGTGHGKGYDHNYVLDARGDVTRLAASVREPKGGRILNVYTTEAGLQFYSGNFLDGTIQGLGGTYNQYGAFCLEAQGFPDSINQPKFPSIVLSPGETYRQTTVYQFTTDQT